MPPAAFTLCAARFWQGWLPALFNETVVPLTGLGAPLVSFPFVDLGHVMPSQGLMRQFVMVLVARFRMSVAEIAAVARAQLGDYYDGLDLERAQVRIRKEQHATFVPDPDSESRRPRPGRLDGGPTNLLVCGDWTDTGFPATLEGAARSSEQLLASLR